MSLLFCVYLAHSAATSRMAEVEVPHNQCMDNELEYLTLIMNINPTSRLHYHVLSKGVHHHHHLPLVQQYNTPYQLIIILLKDPQMYIRLENATFYICRLEITKIDIDSFYVSFTHPSMPTYLTIILNLFVCLFVCSVITPKCLDLKGSNFQCLIGVTLG